MILWPFDIDIKAAKKAILDNAISGYVLNDNWPTSISMDIGLPYEPSFTEEFLPFSPEYYSLTPIDKNMTNGELIEKLNKEAVMRDAFSRQVRIKSWPQRDRDREAYEARRKKFYDNVRDIHKRLDLQLKEFKQTQLGKENEDTVDPPYMEDDIHCWHELLFTDRKLNAFDPKAIYHAWPK